MKKNYISFLFAALMLFVAMPAKAQVSGMSDLFGTYKFTATITPTAAGQEYTDLWESECEVIITKGEQGAPASVQGLMGASENQTVASIDVDNNVFYVINPNPSYGLLSQNPYIGVADMSLENLQMYTMEYHFDPDTKEITIPDFSICLFSWATGEMTGEVLAAVSNVKMELDEAEEVVIPEIEGQWTYKPYNMDYVRNDSTFAYEFTIDLAAKDDTKTLYDATFNIEGFEPFTLDATFNGVDLIMPFDNLYLDAEQKIRLGVKATTLEMTLIKEGQLSFSYSNSTLMWQGDYFVVRQDVITTEEVDGEVVEKESAVTLQQISYGWIERKDPNAYDWAGVYTVNVGDLEDFYEEDGIDFPSTFEMEVVAGAGGTYTVTKFAGYQSDYYPSIELIPGEDGKSATLDLKGYYGFVILQTLGSVDGGTESSYHVLTDLYGESTYLTITANEDGSLSFEDFTVSNMLYPSYTYDALAYMSGVTAEKYVETTFDWAGEYTLTATVQTENGIDAESFPATFNVVVEYDEGKGKYGIMKFMNVDFHELNQGNNDLEIAEDGKSAILPLDAAWGCCFVGGAYPDYVILCDKEGNSTSVTVTLSDETLAMDNFTVYAYNFNTLAASKLATYSNVTLTRKPDPVITLTAEVTEATREFLFGSAVEGENKISIDWGDGTIVEGATITDVYDGWTTTSVTGTPKGNGEIKIYATGAICYFDCVSKVGEPGITTLDVSKATELTGLHANGNKLTSFDGSMLEKLKTLYLNNNSLTEVSLPDSLTYLKIDNNKLTSFDASNLTAVTTLYVSENNLGTLDVSGMPALKSLYALNCGLTSIKIGALTTAKAYVSVNNNLLETLDVSEATGLENGSLFAMGNNLTEIKLPNVKVKAVNISKNKFTLATIPATANVTTLTYVPQQAMVIEDINETIDLSAQNNLVGFAAEAQPTVYTWMTEAGDTLKADVDYVEKAGKFTFIKEQAQKVYCTMTTAALPKFTGTNIFKTVAVTVAKVDTGIEDIVAEDAVEEIFDIFGRKLDAITAPGLYIVNGKKVLVK